MDVLDDLDLTNRSNEPNINLKNSIQYTLILLIINTIVFGAATFEYLDPFPLFGTNSGLLYCLGTYSASVYFYYKAVTRRFFVLLWGLAAWVVGGGIAVFLMDQVLGIRLDAFALIGLLLWGFYTLLTILLAIIIKQFKPRELYDD